MSQSTIRKSASRRTRRLTLFAICVALLASHAAGAEIVPNAYSEPLGIALETWPYLAANTAQLLDTLGVTEVDVIGHSTGGMLAVRFARTYPQRVRRLVLEDPIGLEDYRLKIPPQTLETLIEAERRTTAESYRASIKHYFPLLPADRYEPFVAWRMRVSLSGEFERFAYATAATYEMLYGHPVRYEYRLLVPPVLLVVGAADRTVPFRPYGDPKTVATMGDFPALAKAACHEIPRCELTVVPHVGHVPHMETPSFFNKRVLDFLRNMPE